MIERHLHSLHLEDPGSETPSETRERLRHLFPHGATRRMTQLGLMIGSVLDPLRPNEHDALIYASTYGESRALHEYLASFPMASPTLFQTSIHPSAVQQVLVNRQQPVREFFPFGGCAQIVAHAAEAALLSPAPRVIFCGGEERASAPGLGGAASAVGFAFGFALSAEQKGAAATLGLAEIEDTEGALTLPEFFAALRDRQTLSRAAAPGVQLVLAWH